jgi:hypothetical protein
MVNMKKPKQRKRRLSKTVKIGISLPQDQLEYVDGIAEESEVSRSEVFQWIIAGLMINPEAEDFFFEEEESEEEGESEESEEKEEEEEVKEE